ncbi:MAG TPA: hypothetical protein VLE97_07895 [Gaiellaceae bacterium]|nr:hypothetical protein [Gaiellaceae bacterium]
MARLDLTREPGGLSLLNGRGLPPAGREGAAHHSMFVWPEPMMLGRTPANATRSMTGSAEKLEVNPSSGRVAKRPVSTWQTAAWGYFESIGEIHFGLSLVGQLVSRIFMYAGIVEDPASPPVDADTFLKSYDDRGLDPKLTRELLTEAKRLVANLMGNGAAAMLSSMTVQLSVPGEFYLVQLPESHNLRWVVASSEELTESPAGGWKLRTDRTSSRPESEIELPKGTFVARIFRSHPRYSGEPDSSMLGVLDECELLTVLNQLMRSMLRSRMNAGIVFVPDGLVNVAGATEDGATVQDAIVKMVQTAVADEASSYTAAPLVLQGPADIGKALLKIELGRPVDDTLVSLADRTLERILVGIDVPKEIVQGFADVKFANALVIDDNLFRAHIEPLALLIVDSLTSVYLRPLLKKFVEMKTGVDPSQREGMNALIHRITMWFDASGLITRPDRSQAANEGLSAKVLSEAAWRTARGFAEADKPSNEEVLRRIAIERATLSPEQAAVLLETMDPALFKASREAGQKSSNFPPGLDQLLEGGAPPSIPAPPGAPPSSPTPAPPSPLDKSLEGGQLVSPGGHLPPRR